MSEEKEIFLRLAGHAHHSQEALRLVLKLLERITESQRATIGAIDRIARGGVIHDDGVCADVIALVGRASRVFEGGDD